MRSKFVFTDNLTTVDILPDKNTQYTLYIHIPFCENLCPYCSFFRVELDKPLARNYFDTLRKEIYIHKEKGAVINTVYIGGGTPTVLPDQLFSLLDFLCSHFPIEEISIETNPKDLTADIMESLRKSGVKRLSVGVQTFDDEILDKSGRLQKYGSGQEIKAKLQKAAGIFETLNIDMIFNFPGQTRQMLLRDLEMIKETGVGQITYYPLMISSLTQEALKTVYGKINYKQERLFYNIIQTELIKTYEQSSVWCFSQKNSMIDEYVVQNPEYIGVGAGALSYIDDKVYVNSFSIPRYMEMINQGELPLGGYQQFSPHDRYNYDLLYKLFGRSFFIRQFELHYDRPTRMLGRLKLLGFLLLGIIKKNKDRIILREKGYYCLLAMMREMLSGLNSFRTEAIKKVEETL